MGGNGIDQIILHWRSLLRELIYTLPQATSCSSVLFSHGIKSNCSPEIVSFPSPVQRSCLSVLTGSLTTGGACSPSVFFPRPSASCPVWGYRTASGVMVSLTTAALLVLQSSCDSRFALVGSAHCFWVKFDFHFIWSRCIAEDSCLDAPVR